MGIVVRLPVIASPVRAVEPVREDRWSPRRTLAFIVIVCGAFWLAVVWWIVR